MKSPYTGKEMKKITEKRKWNFRGEEYEYIHTAWLCEDSNEQFTTDESDMDSYNQVTMQYRQKYGIPSTEEIIKIRKCYELSAAKMSLILGIGINQYRLYEHDEVPNISNGRLIRLISEPNIMLKLVESAKSQLTTTEYNKITKHLKDLTKN